MQRTEPKTGHEGERRIIEIRRTFKEGQVVHLPGWPPLRIVRARHGEVRFEEVEEDGTRQSKGVEDKEHEPTH